ncbi:hypothetical protein Tco_0145996 [Tanacetum coccineum]
MFTDTVVKLNLQKLCLVAMSSVHESEQLHLVRWWKLGGVSGSREGMGKMKEDGIKSSMRKTPRNHIARLVPNKVIQSQTKVTENADSVAFHVSNHSYPNETSTTDATSKEKSKKPSAPRFFPLLRINHSLYCDFRDVGEAVQQGCKGAFGLVEVRSCHIQKVEFHSWAGKFAGPHIPTDVDNSGLNQAADYNQSHLLQT